MRCTTRVLAAAALAAAVLAFAAPAAAGLPRLEVSTNSLSFPAANEPRALTLTNVGDEVLHVGNLGIVMFAARANVYFDVDNPAARELEPGASATINIKLRAPATQPAGQIFGALLIPADDPRLPQDIELHTGAPIARRIAGVALRVGQSHLLTWMIALPFVGFLLLAIAPVRRWRHAGFVAPLAVGATLVLAVAAALRFDPTFTIEDGNRGVQLAAHVVLSRALDLEYFVGVDGASLLFVLLAPLVGLTALLAARALPPERRATTVAALLLAQAGATGVFVALDGALFGVAWAATAAGLVALVGPRAPRGGGAPRVAPFTFAAAASTLLLCLGLGALRAHAAATYLYDGTPVVHGFDLTAFAGGGLAARLGAPVLGVPAPLAVGAALFAAFALAIPLFPFHGWAAGTFARATAPAALALGGLFATMGAYGLVRLGAGALPEAVRAASPILLVAGALGALHAALMAASTRDLAALFAHASALRMAFCVLGVAALTPAALAGVLVTAFANGLLAVLVFTLLGGLERPLTFASLEGLGAAAPGAARGLTFALAASAVAPGLATFVGPALVTLDLSTRQVSVALVVFVAFAVAAGAHARAGAVILSRADASGPGVAAARTPDARTLALVVPVAALLLALGLVPAAMLDAVGATVLALVR